ncbi:MAG: hypothetical protein V2I36_12765 [Desulfopila sp.]|jgi:transposase|nr:hypothetical protein [Desulfopila sp.]
MKTHTFDNLAIRNQLKKMLANAEKKSDFQRVQCVWLRYAFGMKASQVAQITNLQPGTVRKIWSLFGREGEKSLFCGDRGGRRNSHLSREEEKLFLAPFFMKNKKSKLLNVSEVHIGYEKIIGKKVPKSTIYRLLSRHGWKRKTSAINSRKNIQKSSEEISPMHEYWIEGCSQVLHPERTGNISQQWLNSTLQSMVKTQ